MLVAKLTPYRFLARIATCNCSHPGPPLRASDDTAETGHRVHQGERRLEAEAVFIMREAAAEFRNPVMLYSIGKDSSDGHHTHLWYEFFWKF